MSLGMLLGGVAKGYQEGEDIQDQRAKRAAAKQKLAEDQAAFERQQDQQAGQGALGVVGQTMIPANLDYDPTQSVQDAIAARHANAVPQNKPGLIGILAQRLNPKSAAIGSGVTPINDPMQNPLGLANGTPVGPTATPVGTPQVAPAAPTAAPDGSMTVTSPSRKVPLTEEQQAARMAYLMQQTGTPEQALAAGKALVDVHNNNTLRAIQNSSAAGIENLAGDAGFKIQIDPDVGKDGKPNGAYIVKDQNGQVVRTAKDINDLRNQASAMLDNDQGHGMAAFHASNADTRASMLAAATIGSEAKRANAAVAEAQAALTNASSNKDRTQAEVANLNDNLEKAKMWRDAQTQLGADPDMAYTDPRKFSQLQSVIEFAAGKIDEGTTRTTNVDGSSFATSASRVGLAGAQRAAAIKNDPAVQSGVVTTTQGPNGPLFAVGDPKSAVNGKPTRALGYFATSDEAFQAARRAWPQLYSTKKK